MVKITIEKSCDKKRKQKKKRRARSLEIWHVIDKVSDPGFEI